MFNKFELVAGGVSVFFMALAIYLTQASNIFFGSSDGEQSAQLAALSNQGVAIVDETGAAQVNAYNGNQSNDNLQNNSKTMVIDDVKIGTGDAVEAGDVVAVHYAGTLQNGQEFDNSRKRGEPLEFKVGAGQVIEGWDEGLVGMQVGGQRVLVIPPEKAYGNQAIGPIPANSTLVFNIELMEIK